MKKIIELINEAKRKTFKLGNNEVVKGQQIKIKSPYDESKELTVNYLKPHESEKYFYCIDSTGSTKAFLVSNITEIIPFTEPAKKSSGPRKMSREQAEKLQDEIYELKQQLRSLMMDQEEYAAQAMENNPDLDADAPNYDKDYTDCWKEIDKLSTKITKLEQRLDAGGYCMF